MHSLLTTNVTDDLICITEPWFNHIGTARSDTLRDGCDVLGGAAHPNWDIQYPYFTDNQRAKVMVYSHQFHQEQPSLCIPWRLVVRNDIGRHPCLLIIDVYDGSTLLWVITFYRDADDPSSITALLGLDLDPTIPTLLIGDFNYHSPTWSAPELGTSPHCATFEMWAASQTFTVQTPSGMITRCSHDGECPSPLDLTLHNLASNLNANLSPPLYDWAASLRSNHVGICTSVVPVSVLCLDQMSA